jgi:hypothetical protein
VEAVELTDPGPDKGRVAAVPLVTQAINSTGEETEQTAINSTGLLWLEENVIIWFVRALESLLFFFFKI